MNTPVPQEFLERMQSLLGEDFASFSACYGQAPESGLRVNTLKISPQEFSRLSGWNLNPVPWCPAAFYAPPGLQPGKHPYHAAGLYYLQDPSAMLAAEALKPIPGERVLDLAAAPGGKSTHLAALLQGQGSLLANEIHPRRAWELAENLERWGTRNAAITNERPERLAERLGAIFDKVLLDAPCSGEGMFRKSEAARQAWSPALVESCARRQAALLVQAGGLVVPGGLLLYTTCTFSPEENEGVIARFLKTHPEFELRQITQQSGFAAGYSDWSYGDERFSAGSHLGQAVRLWPQRVRGEGHFLALLQRTGAEPPSRPRQANAPSLALEARRLLEGFTHSSLSSWSADGQVVQHGAYLYQMPEAGLDLKGLHTIHPGLWLGTLKKNRFEPSQALAMSLKAEQAVQVIRLDEAGALDYLRGRLLPAPGGETGWALITLQGFALGWGKCSQGSVKNYYPHGLRWQG